MFTSFIKALIKNSKVQWTILVCLVLDYYRSGSLQQSSSLICTLGLSYIGLCYFFMTRMPLKPVEKIKRISDQYRQPNKEKS